jgi:antirestriction protein ArdC
MPWKNWLPSLALRSFCTELAITVEPRVNHAQYLTHWLNVLKADKHAIFAAAYIAAEAATLVNDKTTAPSRHGQSGKR